MSSKPDAVWLDGYVPAVLIEVQKNRCPVCGKILRQHNRTLTPHV